MACTVPIEIAAHPHNAAYLATKRDKMGHEILRGPVAVLAHAAG